MGGRPERIARVHPARERLNCGVGSAMGGWVQLSECRDVTGAETPTVPSLRGTVWTVPDTRYGPCTHRTVLPCTVHLCTLGSSDPASHVPSSLVAKRGLTGSTGGDVMP